MSNCFRSVEIVRTTISGNTAYGTFGGAIYAESANLTIDMSVLINNVCNNTNAQGGGVYIDLKDYGN